MLFRSNKGTPLLEKNKGAVPLQEQAAVGEGALLSESKHSKGKRCAGGAVDATLKVGCPFDGAPCFLEELDEGECGNARK